MIMATINFKGKEIVRNYHLTVPYHELAPDAKKSLSKTPSLNDNLIIHGDNLLALKALLPTYAGKVKCIYIDPPYNTGNEKWAYNDNVNSPMMKDWLGKVVDKDDLTRHDKWLCMMMPRLKLLRELLRDDGVIFVSIDDNEVHNLRMLMNEAFGENNFVATITVQSNPRGRQSEKFFAPVHEYLVVYANNLEQAELFGLELTESQLSEYKFDDKGGRKYRLLGLRQRGAASRREDRPNMYYPVYVDPSKKTISLKKDSSHYITVLPKKSTGEEGRWGWSQEKVLKNINLIEVRLISGRGEWDIFVRDYLEDDDGEKTSKSKTLWREREINYQNGKDEINKIFGHSIFEYPKPSYLIEKVISISTSSDSIILDSFSGSGTTAHAALALNKEDGGKRKFILVEMEDYADKITAERVRRVIKGVKNSKDESLKKGLGGQFSYFELGKPIDAQRILKGEDLPSFVEMARYIFYTATGEEFNEKKIDQNSGFIGESKEYKVYLLYKPDLEYLKNTALTLDFAQQLGKSSKKRLVFAPTKYLDREHLERLGVEFAQLPFEIYQRVK